MLKKNTEQLKKNQILNALSEMKNRLTLRRLYLLLNNS